LFFPKIRRNPMAATNGTMAVVTRAYGLSSCRTVDGCTPSSVASVPPPGSIYRRLGRRCYR
jgi:hypothetical protein